MNHDIFHEPSIYVVAMSSKITNICLSKIRMYMLTLLIFMYIMNGIVLPPCLYRPFTLWGLTLTIIYFTLSLISYHQGRSYSEEDYEIMQHQNHRTFNKITVIIFETAWTSEFLIIVVYIFVLAPLVLIKKLVPATASNIIFALVDHIIPFSFLATDLSFNTIVFSSSHIVYSIGLGVLFLIMDCICVLRFHDIEYFIILEWDNYLTIVSICLAIILMWLGDFIGRRISRKNMIHRKDGRKLLETNYNEENLISVTGKY